MEPTTEQKTTNGSEVQRIGGARARPDCYFSAEQIHRLQFLMQRSQEAAEETGPPLTAAEEAERNALIEAELLASAERTGALADALGR